MTNSPTRKEIEEHVLGLLQQLARDWDYGSGVSPQTRLFTDLGFESLDAVVLGTAIQDHYHRAMPFSELLVEIGNCGRDLRVSELVDFVSAHVGAPARRTSEAAGEVPTRELD
jgi:acyl carrier protein